MVRAVQKGKGTTPATYHAGAVSFVFADDDHRKDAVKKRLQQKLASVASKSDDVPF